MTKASKNSETPSIMDVAHPGKSSPTDTSKPIITSRKIMQDPMVVMTDDKPVLPDVDEPAAVPSEKKQPVSKIRLHPGADVAAKADKAEVVESQEAKISNPTPVPDATPAETDDAADKTDAPRDLDKQLASENSQSAEDKADSIRAEFEAKLQKAYDSKQYFLPINALEHRRTARFVALGILLSVLLALLWVNIALDASLIKLGDLKPVTHFFSK